MKRIQEVMLERMIDLAKKAGYVPSGDMVKDAITEHMLIKFAYLIAAELAPATLQKVIPIHNGSGPYSQDKWERIKDDQLTPEQREQVIAWEDCNSFQRCKCETLCRYGVIPKPASTEEK